MQKFAQKRNFLNKLREMTDVSGIAAEKFFNPEFQRVMESLRAKDDTIRSIAAGETIGSGDPGNDPISLKALIKSASSNLNRREYMSAIAELGRFHNKINDIVKEINNFNVDVDAVHHEFLFKELGDDQKKYLHDLKTRFASTQSLLRKEAGVMDFFYNIGTKRGRALAAWEKRYPKQVGKLKKDTSNLLNKSESLLGTTLSSLKEMASARATRNVDSYIKSAEKISKSYAVYDKLFRDFYVENVKGFLEKVELVSPTTKNPEAEGLAKQDIPINDAPKGNTVPSSPVPAAFNEEIPDLESITNEPPAEPFTGPETIPSPPPVNMDEMNEEEFKSDQVAKEIMTPKAAHYKFFRSLEALSSEDPIILASFIKKYALTIKDSDPTVARKLLNISKIVKG